MIVHVAITRPTPWDTVRTVTHISPAPCTHPARVVCGERTVWVACGRREPAHRQCAGCRIRIITESDQPALPITLPTDHLAAATGRR